MIDEIIWWTVMFSCAVLFYGIGIYAQKRKNPMWFWSGKEVDVAEITDVKQYNKENGVMWKLYSLWYFASAFVQIWSDTAALVIFVMSWTIGFLILVCSYKKIYSKYRKM